MIRRPNPEFSLIETEPAYVPRHTRDSAFYLAGDFIPSLAGISQIADRKSAARWVFGADSLSEWATCSKDCLLRRRILSRREMTSSRLILLTGENENLLHVHRRLLLRHRLPLRRSRAHSSGSSLKTRLLMVLTFSLRKP